MEIIYVHLGNILGRTYEEIVSAYNTFTSSENPNRFFYIIYWLGKLAINETCHEKKRAIIFPKPSL